MNEIYQRKRIQYPQRIKRAIKVTYNMQIIQIEAEKISIWKNCLILMGISTLLLIIYGYHNIALIIGIIGYMISFLYPYFKIPRIHKKLEKIRPLKAMEEKINKFEDEHFFIMK